MKDARNQNNHQSKQQPTNRPVPDVRDDLDSRSNKEGENYKDNNNKEGKKPNSKDKNEAGH